MPHKAEETYSVRVTEQGLGETVDGCGVMLVQRGSEMQWNSIAEVTHK